MSCPASRHELRDRPGTQMEPATEKQGGVASCQSHCWGIVSQTCTRRRVGEGPLLSQGGGKKETAIVGTVPEA